MSRLPFKLAALVISALAVGAVSAVSNDEAVTLKQIAGYREWTKMNPEAVKIENTVDLKALAGG